MGAISKAKVREDKIGGSAYQTEDTTLCGGCFGFFGGGGTKKKEQSVSASQRREGEVFYALKTIVISRISPEFIEELRNEIDILKNLDHPNIVKVSNPSEPTVKTFGSLLTVVSVRRLRYSKVDSQSTS